MGYLVVLFLLPLMLGYTIKRPWTGVMMYYLFSILQPKYIWFWIFPQDLSITKFLVLAIFVGVSLKIISGEYKLSFFSDRRSIALFILFILLYLSDFFSRYPPLPMTRLLLTTMNTIIAVYFMGQMCKPSLNDLKHLAYIIVGIVLYYSYWANIQYTSGAMYLYSTNGRLRGPVGSTYFDENGFSVVFIFGLPFLAFLYFLLNRLWQKMLIIAAVIAALHSLILIGSRGALISFVVMVSYSLFALIRTSSGKRPYMFFVLVMVSLGFFFASQGGTLKERTTSTIESGSSDNDAPIDPRVLAWGVGRDMIFDYPILGVGVERFVKVAAIEYPGRTVNVPHNTFIQVAANSGIISGIMWLALVLGGINCGRKIWKKYPNPGTIENYLNNSLTVSFIGFFVVAMFLDLLIAEQFYCILLMQLLFKRLVEESPLKTKP